MLTAGRRIVFASLPRLTRRLIMTSHIYASTAAPVEPPAAIGTSSNGPDAPPAALHLTSHNQYSTPRLTPDTLLADPLLQFNAWFTALRDQGVREPEAMTLSTATPQGVPSSRTVLLKTVDRGFVFFTNYTSRKSAELLQNPHAALNFYWKEVSKQVRVVGVVEKVSREESEEYFNTRPRGSQLGAWASPQSKPVGEGELEELVKQVDQKFVEKVACPEFWGGWRIMPFEVEFWSGQPSRLHDRFRYTKSPGDEKWKIERLGP